MRRANWRNKVHPSKFHDLKHKVAPELPQQSERQTTWLFFFKSINVLYLPAELLEFNRLIPKLRCFETPITRVVFKTDFCPIKGKGN